MASASVSIFEEAKSSTGQLVYELRLTGADGTPLVGEEVLLTLDGDGSFATHFSSKEIRRQTDSDGRATVTWFRRSIYHRDVKATLVASHPSEEASIALALAGTTLNDGPWISWAPRRRA